MSDICDNCGLPPSPPVANITVDGHDVWCCAPCLAHRLRAAQAEIEELRREVGTLRASPSDAGWCSRCGRILP